MTTVAVIPARYASTRFPGKPLAKQTGKYLVQHVFESVRACNRIDRVIVATDDERIVKAVESFGGEAQMTSDEHRTGTDRIGEVAAWTGLAFYLGRRAEATLVMLAIVGVCGSLLIPYIRAKAEAEGVEGKGGIMGRAERLLVFGFGIGLAGLGLPTLAATVWSLALLTWLTVLQRFYRTWVQLGP